MNKLENILFEIGKQDVIVDENKKKLLVNELFTKQQPSVGLSQRKNWYKNVFNRYVLGSSVVITAFMLFGYFYLSSSPSTPPSNNGLNTYSFSGFIQKGPFIAGSEVTLQELNKQMEPTGTTFVVNTRSDFGDYEFAQKLSSPYVEVIARGYYFNEVQGALSESELTLRAITDLSKTPNVNVNVLTTLASNRIKHLVVEEGLDFRLAQIKAHQEVLSIFSLRDLETPSFEHLDLSKDDVGDGVLIALSSVLQGNLGVAELSELVSKLSLDLETDGRIDQYSLLDKVVENARSIDVVKTRANLSARFEDLGLKVVIPDFEIFMKKLVEFSILYVFPEDDSENVIPEQSISIVFSKEVDPSSIMGKRLYLQKNKLDIQTETEISSDLRLVTLVPLKPLEKSPSRELDGLSSYTLVVEDGVRSYDGETIDETSEHTFSTVRHSPLTVSYANPERNSVNVDYSTSISVHFDKSLNVMTISGSTVTVTNKESFAIVNGKVSVGADGTSVQFTPSQRFDPNSTYQVKVDYKTRSTDGGTMLDDYVFEFSTVRVDLEDGLVAYYPFSNNTNDASGNNYHATAVGVSLTSDRFGKEASAYSFDGYMNYIDIPHSFGLHDNNWTISFWLKADNTIKHTSGGNILATFPDNRRSYTDYIRIVQQGNKPEDRYMTCMYFGGYLYGYDLEEWDLYTLVKMENEYLLYVNSKLGNRSDYSMTYYYESEYPYTIGSKLTKEDLSYDEYGARPLYADIDEVRFYNRSLSIYEVEQLYDLNE